MFLNKSLQFILILLFSFFVVKTANAAITIRPALNLGLVGYWSMDEGYGTTAYDQSGNGSSGTLSGTTKPTWTDGKRGKALSFDGVNNTGSFIDAGNKSVLQPASAVTISAWVKPQGTDGQYQAIVTKDSATVAYWFGLNSLNPYFILTSNGYTQSNSYAAASLSIGTWYHLIAVYDGTDQRVYINGVLDSNGSNNPKSYASGIFSNSSRALIGKSDYWGGNEFNGSIDEVRVYNRALSAGEVTRLYNLTGPKIKAANDTGLVGYWSFEEGQGTKAGDMSGRGNYGTLSADSGNITITNLTSATSTNNPATTASVSPAAGSVVYVSVAVAQDTTPTAAELGISGCGLTWSQVAEQEYGHRRVLFSWKGVGTPSAGALTITYTVGGGGTFQEMSYSVNQVTGADGTTPNDAAVSSFNDGVTLLDLPDVGTPDAGDVVFCAFGVENASDSIALTGSITQITKIENGGNVRSFINGYEGGTPDEMPGITWNSSGAAGGIGFIINAGAGDASEMWTDGKRGKALSFDGTSYVNISNPSSFEFGVADWTVSSWVRRGDLNDDVIFVKSSASSWADKGKQIYLAAVGENYKLSFDAWGIGVWYSNTAITDTNWHHVSVAFRDSDNLLTFYVDGVSDGTASPALTADDASHVLSFGGVSYSSNGKNTLDEVRVYNRALSQAEITNLYTASKKIMRLEVSQNNQLTSGLVGLWSFNGPDISGATAYDRSGSNNNGTINGATLDSGKVGQALSFDGTSDYISIANDPIGTNTVTVCTWIYPKDFDSWQSIVGNDHFVFGPYDSGGALILTSDGGSTEIFSNNLSLNQWQHVCAVRLSNGTGTIYVNGAQSGDPGNTNTDGGATGLAIGTYRIQSPASLFFHGLIDEVRVYSRALSAAEIKRLWNMGK